MLGSKIKNTERKLIYESIIYTAIERNAKSDNESAIIEAQ
jgi:hypothetical protein